MIFNQQLDTLMKQLEKLKAQGYTPSLNQSQVKLLIQGYKALRSYTQVLEEIAVKEDGVDVIKLWEEARRWSPPDPKDAVVPQTVRLLGHTYKLERER